MKKLTILFVALSMVTVSALAVIAADNKGPAVVELEASMGKVTFEHAKHQDRVADCATCHHAGFDVSNCKSCHDAKPDVPNAKKVFHQLCKDCHKNESGPTKCKECHIK